MWSANIILSDLSSLLSPFRCVALCSLDFPSVTFPFRSTSVFAGHCVFDDLFCSLGGFFTDRLQCAVFGVFCVGFVLRGFGLFGVCIK